MIFLVRMGNIVDMDLLIAWFGHLGIPQEWVVPCFLMVDVVHTLINNVLLPLYLLLQFYYLLSRV